MVIRIVVVIGEDGGVCIWKKSEIRVEVVSGVDTFRIGVDVGGSEIETMSYTSLWTRSSWILVWVLDSESSWVTEEGDLGWRSCFLIFFFGVLRTSKVANLALHFHPLFGLFTSSRIIQNSSMMGRMPDEDYLWYTFTMALSWGTISNITPGIEPTKLNLVGLDIINKEVFKIGITTITESSNKGTR